MTGKLAVVWKSHRALGHTEKARRREPERRAKLWSVWVGGWRRSDGKPNLEVRTKPLVRKPASAQGPQHSAKSFSGRGNTVKNTDVEFVVRDIHLVRDVGVSSRASARFPKSVGKKDCEGVVESAAKAVIAVELLHQLCLVEEECQAVSAGRNRGRCRRRIHQRYFADDFADAQPRDLSCPPGCDQQFPFEQNDQGIGAFTLPDDDVAIAKT